VSKSHRVQFGHSDAERLVLSEFKWDGDYYQLDAELCARGFRGVVRVYGFVQELHDLHKSLQNMSVTLSGEAKFKNLEHQLEIHCSIGVRGTVNLEISLWDYSNYLKCRFETDPASLDSTIASLGKALG
jgi:hypothetical protein